MIEKKQTWILVVDDEPRLADTLAAIFEHAGYSARSAYSGEQALSQLCDQPTALVVSDVMMPGMNGIGLAKKVRRLFPGCQVLLFSGNAETHELLDAARQEGYYFEVLSKPVPPPYMIAKVNSLLAN